MNQTQIELITTGVATVTPDFGHRCGAVAHNPTSGVRKSPCSITVLNGDLSRIGAHVPATGCKYVTHRIAVLDCQVSVIVAVAMTIGADDATRIQPNLPE